MTKKNLVVYTLLAAGAGVQAMFAQSAAPAETAQPGVTPAVAPTKTAAVEEEVVELTPFEVKADKDTGYQATQTLAGTRIRTDLRDVGSAITVVTKELLQDVGATNNGSLLQYTTNAEVAGTKGTYAGLGNGTGVDETAALRAPAGAQRVRGLASADITRDFFVTDIPWDSFNVDRLDIQRGPNSILFGLGSPAGIVNAGLRNAEFKNSGKVEARVGSYNSTRATLDVNQQLIDKVLAIRIDGLWNNEKFRQKPAFQDDKRVYGTVRFEPDLFKDRRFHTIVKVKLENGDIKANRPRIVPPQDSITPWFRPIDLTSANGGLGKYAVTDSWALGASPSTTNPWLSGAMANQQQPVWMIDGTTNELFKIYGGYINTGARNSDGTIRNSASNLVGQRYANPFYSLGGFADYATLAKLPQYQYGQYRNVTLQDPTVFDFYNQLIDGNTKHEWEKWNAGNFTLSQTGWNNRVGLDISYDQQSYNRGGEQLLGNPTLSVDITKTMQDFSTNPNFGRAFVQTGAGSGSSYQSDRKYFRAAVFGELRSRDFLHSEFLQKLLGRHDFNLSYSNEKYQTENRSWALYAHSLDWQAYWTRTDGNTTSFTDRAPSGAIYLGSSLANATTASGANLPGISAPVKLSSGNVYYFDSTWKFTPGVNFSDAWTVPSKWAAAFDSTATTQASNPDNYVGWNSNFQDNLIAYNGGQNQSLTTLAQKSLRVTRSLAASWQGFLWKDAIVGTFGWRNDEVKSKGVTAKAVSGNRSMLNLDPNVYALPSAFPAAQTFKHSSTAGGVVVHLNRILEKDPLPVNISLSYNKSNNFQVTDTRRDIYGNVIGNPTGSTKDYGVTISTKDDKFSLRLVKYETSVKNAGTQLDSSGLGSTVQQGLRFRNVFLYKLSNYPWSSREQPAQRNTWTAAWVDSNGRPVAAYNAASGPSGASLETDAQAIAHRDATIRAWNDIQAYLQGKGYFSAWGYTPTTLSALTDRATYEAAKTSPTALDPAAQYLPDTATVFGYAASAPQGFAVTADTVSKGYELELTANPTKNWRISFNASETEAVRTNVGGPVLDEFVSYIDKAMAGYAGDMRQFNGDYVATNEVRYGWNNWRAKYTLLKLQEGSAASEIRKFRYNIITNYNFSNGFLKGTGIGGAYRWQDKVVIGYPVIAGTGGLASFDLTKPYYGPSEDGIDLWASYTRRLTEKIEWKIQLNVRNAFAKDGLIPISVQPDGQTWASARVKPAQEWTLTNTFSF